MKPYDYAHRIGVRHISWEDFVSLARKLSELIEPYHPQVILGIARAGLFPATLMACSLRCEMFPIRLTRRVNDQVVCNNPVWKTSIPSEVGGKVVVVVDEIVDTGTTLSTAGEAARTLGAVQVVTACLVSHSWAKPAPQITSLVSDEFIIFPWDELVLDHGQWVPHPEIESGIKAQTQSPKN
jgi:hypoxanthine phosphoribosyltransferase